MSESGHVRVERRGATAEVVLDRPAKRNAVTLAMFHDLRDAFVQLSADDSVRALVLRGEGAMFTAGLDLVAAASMMQPPEGSPAQRSRFLADLIEDLQSAPQAIADCRHPVIAAVHGQCLGAGVDFITACDVRVCSADASFAVFETRIALVADLGTLQRLPGIVGRGVAREMALTGRYVHAERALAVGLVNEVHPDAEATLQGARALAEEMASHSPLAVRGTKRVMNYSDEHGIERGLEFVAQWNTAYVQSNDLAEAIAAFMQRRPGEFTGT